MIKTAIMLSSLGLLFTIFTSCKPNCEKQLNCEHGNPVLSEEGNCKCECNPGYTGIHCNFLDCNHAIKCINGTASIDVFNNCHCDCNDGYSGVACDIRDCSKAIACENGTPKSDDNNNCFCECEVGYEGPACELASAQFYLDDWEATDTCKSGYAKTYFLECILDSTLETNLRILNFGGWDTIDTLSAFIDVFSFKVNYLPLNSDTTIDALGIFDKTRDTLHLVYDIYRFGNRETQCESTWIRR